MKITLYCQDIFEAIKTLDEGKSATLSFLQDNCTKIPVEIDLEKYSLNKTTIGYIVYVIRKNK